MKGFDKCNLTKPVSKVFVVIWVKGQGQSRSWIKKKSVKIKNCLNYVKFGFKLKDLTRTMQISKTKLIIFHKAIKGIKI